MKSSELIEILKEHLDAEIFVQQGVYAASTCNKTEHFKNLWEHENVLVLSQRYLEDERK